MYRVIFLLVGFAAVLFLIAAVWLVCLNPSTKIIQSALSILAAAAITGFAATMLSLKETHFHDAFISTVFFKKATGEPAAIRPPSHFKREIQSLEMSRVANMAKEAGLPPPKDGFQASTDLLLQMILRELANGFRERWSVELREVTGSGGHVLVPLVNPARPKERHIILSREALSSLLRGNSYGGISESLQMALPPKTNLEISSYIALTGNATISFNRSRFFNIHITLTPQAGGGDMRGYDPIQFGLSEEVAKTVTSYPVLVEISAHFDRLTSENPETPFYKSWANEMSRSLKASFSDP